MWDLIVLVPDYCLSLYFTVCVCVEFYQLSQQAHDVEMTSYHVEMTSCDIKRLRDVEMSY